jgi:hypothetical protein
MLIRCTNKLSIVTGLANVAYEISSKFIYRPTYQYSGVSHKVEIQLLFTVNSTIDTTIEC